MIMDMETTGLDTSTTATTIMYASELVDPRYVGLNRAQRRAAMSQERKAFKSRSR